MKKIIVICGPTASGKTGYAHLFAKNNNGEIVNADSMQLYKQIPIITASPSDHLKKEIPYHLYNFLDVDDECSLARYAAIAATTIKEIAARGKLPIVVGGTGLYIGALINGFSAIPDVDPAIRAKVRELQQSVSSQEFFNLLGESDSKIISVLHPGDSQRVARAFEVYLQTGKSILEYQENNTKLLADFEFDVTMLLPEREFLYSMCDKRLEQLFDHGAIEEVSRLHLKHKDLKTSAMKALGVQEIIAYLEGKISKEEALETAKLKTRRYAKRQITWFKHQIKEKNVIASPC
jgi:tRNA dimethylallyltransferase